MKSSGTYGSEARIGEKIGRPTRLRATIYLDGVFGIPRDLAERGESAAEYSVHFLGMCIGRGTYQSPPEEPNTRNPQRAKAEPKAPPNLALMSEQERFAVLEDAAVSPKIDLVNGRSGSSKADFEIKGEHLVLFEEFLIQKRPLFLYLVRNSLQPDQGAPAKKLKPEQQALLQPMIWRTQIDLPRAGEADATEVARLNLQPQQTLPFTSDGMYIRVGSFRMEGAVTAELRTRIKANLSELLRRPPPPPPTKQEVLEGFERDLDNDFASKEGFDAGAAKHRVVSTVQKLIFATDGIQNFSGVLLDARDQLYNTAYQTLNEQLHCWARKRHQRECERAALRLESAEVAEERYLSRLNAAGIDPCELWRSLGQESFKRNRPSNARRLYRQAMRRGVANDCVKHELVRFLIRTGHLTDAEGALKVLLAESLSAPTQVLRLLTLTVLEQGNDQAKEGWVLLRYLKECDPTDPWPVFWQFVTSKKIFDSSTIAAYMLFAFQRRLWLANFPSQEDPFTYAFSPQRPDEIVAALREKEREWYTKMIAECVEIGLFRLAAAAFSLLPNDSSLSYKHLDMKAACRPGADPLLVLAKVNAVLLVEPYNADALIEGLEVLAVNGWILPGLLNEMATAISIEFAALDVDQRYRFIWNMVAAYFKLADLISAESYLALGLKLFPHSVHLHLQLAQLSARKGDSTQRISALEAAHQLDPHDIEVLIQLCIAFVQEGMSASIGPMLARLLSLPINREANYDELEHLLEEKNLIAHAQRVTKFLDKNF